MNIQRLAEEILLAPFRRRPVKTCENCGEPVYSLGCTWCNEEAYIEQQEHFDEQHERERKGEQRAPFVEKHVDRLTDDLIARLKSGGSTQDRLDAIEELQRFSALQKVTKALQAEYTALADSGSQDWKEWMRVAQNAVAALGDLSNAERDKSRRS